MQIQNTTALGMFPVKELKGSHFKELATEVQKPTRSDVVDLGNAQPLMTTYNSGNAVQRAANSLFDQITAHFGKEVGKDSELQRLDLDMDGEIGPSDFEAAVSIAQWAEKLPSFEEITNSFGLSAGDKGYDARLDLDGDNEIGPGDFETVVSLANLQSRDMIFEGITERFGLASGDEGYDARYDLDKDGEIGPGDFEQSVATQSARGTQTDKTLSELLGQLLRNPAIAQGLDLNGDGKTTKFDITATISALS